LRNDPREGLVFGAWSPHEQGFVLGDSGVDLISQKPVMAAPRGMVKRWRGCKIEFLVRYPENWGCGISGEGTERSIAAEGREADRHGLIRDHANCCAGVKIGPGQHMSALRMDQESRRRRCVLDDRVQIMIKGQAFSQSLFLPFVPRAGSSFP
jgi:hypothetical protein